MSRSRKSKTLATRWHDVMPCYLTVLDPQLRITETNEFFQRDFGDQIGEHCYKAYLGRDRPCESCPVQRTFADGKNHSGEETVITKHGETAHVVVTSTPILDKKGRVESVVEMATNVTELKTLREEYDREKEAFETLFDLVPCYITVQNPSFVVEQTNKLFRQDFGDFTGNHCFRAYKGRDSICHDCPVERTFADGKVHSSEETVTTRGGQRAQVIVQSMPIHDEEGKIASVMEVSTNITEVKQLQHRLALMGLAVAGMAHRVKNILMGLEGGIFVVNTGFEMKEPDTVKDGWGMVERNVGRISRTVKDLLYCSKQHDLQMERDVNVEEIVREVFELYEPRAAREGIELRLEILGPVLRGTFNPEGLFKMVTNLTSNALDACRFDPARDKKQHKITLRCTRNDDSATIIEVADNGSGIPDDVHHKVFENFFSTKGTEGTGLGLLMVQKVVEEHGGTISFTSKEGSGTTFRIELPDRADVGPDFKSQPEGDLHGSK